MKQAINNDKIQTKQYICMQDFSLKIQISAKFLLGLSYIYLSWYPEKTEITKHWWGFFIIYQNSKFKKEPACYNRVKLILTIKNIKIHYLHLRVCQPGWCHASDIEKSYWGFFFSNIKNFNTYLCKYGRISLFKHVF